MQRAETEPRICGACLGMLLRVRHVPLKSLEGQRIFECADCGQLTMVFRQLPPVAQAADAGEAELLNLL
jgi:hypothetical protein